MTLAVLLAAMGACCNAAGARLQHGAVHDTIGDRGLGVRNQLNLVRNNTWRLGLMALGSGAILHACALGMAPLSVVQPIGVLALPLTVVFGARSRSTGAQGVRPGLVLAVLAATGGVSAFVLLAAGSATSTPVPADAQLLATQLVVVAVAALCVLGFLSTSYTRCIAYATGCAVAYGFVSLLMRAVTQQLGTTGLQDVNVLPVVGIVAAMVVGGWLLQHAYASGPPDLVVACLTVIDPLVAVGLGIGLLGEADEVGAWTATGEAMCAVIACAGVIALARHRSEPAAERLVHSTATGSRELAGPSSTYRPDGSSS
ncbi:hypothetical protein [Parasphingorhabdus pacifica]